MLEAADLHELDHLSLQFSKSGKEEAVIYNHSHNALTIWMPKVSAAKLVAGSDDVVIKDDDRKSETHIFQGENKIIMITRNGNFSAIQVCLLSDRLMEETIGQCRTYIAGFLEDRSATGAAVLPTE